MNYTINIMPFAEDVDSVALETNGDAYERDYSQMDLVDLIDQPAWKTILLDLVSSEKMDPWILMLLHLLRNI